MNFALIIICLLSGLLLRRFGSLPANAHLGLNSWLVYVAIPATALLYVPTIEWSRQMIWPISAPFFCFFGAWLIWGSSKKESVEQRRTRGALLLSAGLCNTSFVGFPITSAFYGEEGLKIAVVCDQMSFLLLSTVGVIVSLNYSGGEHRLHTSVMLRKLFLFPPFLGFMTGLMLPEVATFNELPLLWSKLSATLIPVALFSIGLQMDSWEGITDPALAKGIVYKLLLAPLAFMVVVWVAGGEGLLAKVAVLEIAMATMATSSVLAVQYGLNARICNLMLGVGIPLSLLTTYGWWLVLERVF